MKKGVINPINPNIQRKSGQKYWFFPLLKLKLLKV
jgi:hypothetical protein